MHPIIVTFVKYVFEVFLDSLPAQYLADAAMADPELAGDITWTYTLMGQLHYPLPHHIRQGPPVYKHPTQLIHPSMPCGHRQQ